MALNTIPMPSDVYDIYPFAGWALGTVGTCELQGFLIQMGTAFTVGSNTALNVYYVCTFRYSMAEEKFKRCVLPLTLAIYAAASVTITSYALRNDLINPSAYSNYCLTTVRPLNCTTRSNDEGEVQEDMNIADVQCIREGEDANYSIIISFSVVIIGTFLIMIISMVLVVASVFDAELGIRRSRRVLQQRTADNTGTSTTRNPVREIEDFQRTRTILTQALMYIFAFLLTWIWSFFTIRRPLDDSTPTPSNVEVFLFTFFRPLQGFFNFIIFVYQKAHALQRANMRLSFFKALKQVIISPSTVPQVVVSHIEIATHDIVLRREMQSDVGQDYNHQNDECESDLSISSGSSSGNGSHDEESNDSRLVNEPLETRGSSTRLRATGKSSSSCEFSSSDVDDSSSSLNVREIRLMKRSSIASSLSRSTRGFGLMLSAEEDQLSLTPEEQSQLSMNVQRKGVGFPPKKTNMHNNDSGASYSDSNCSIPSGVDVRMVVTNGDATDTRSHGVISSMVKSFDESGSYKCAVHDDEDGERSFSVGDLSGFGLSEMGGTFNTNTDMNTGTSECD